MLILPPYPDPVSLIQPHGHLAIPCLPWVVAVPNLELAKMGSFRAMFTTVQGAHFEATLTRYLPHVPTSAALVPADINLLEAGVMADITAIIHAGQPYGANPLLIHVAAGIHLWGGGMGRGAFVRGGGFAANCPLHAYGQLVHLIMTHPSGVPLPGGNWPLIRRLNAQFSQFGPAFYTKHLSFWSRAPGAPIRLPILDRVVKGKFIDPNRPTPAWSDYVPYVTELHADCLALASVKGLAGITITDMERQLFNWANSPDASAWIR
jgi:hypothetical protein